MADIPESIGVFRPETARALLADYRKRAGQINENAPAEPAIYRTPIYFHNDTGFEIPPYAVLQVKAVRDDIVTYHDVKRPYDYDACQTTMLINGPYAVAIGERGTAQSGPVYRVIHDDAISYAIGDRLGWKADSFQVGLGSLLVNLGADMVEENCLRVMMDFSQMRGVTTSTITAGSSGTFQRRKATSTTFATDTSKTYTGWNDSTTDIASGARVLATCSEGRWTLEEIC